jgi:hypothetical protein
VTAISPPDSRKVLDRMTIRRWIRLLGFAVTVAVLHTASAWQGGWRPVQETNRTESRPAMDVRFRPMSGQMAPSRFPAPRGQQSPRYSPAPRSNWDVRYRRPDEPQRPPIGKFRSMETHPPRVSNSSPGLPMTRRNVPAQTNRPATGGRYAITQRVDTSGDPGSSATHARTRGLVVPTSAYRSRFSQPWDSAGRGSALSAPMAVPTSLRRHEDHSHDLEKARSSSGRERFADRRFRPVNQTSATVAFRAPESRGSRASATPRIAATVEPFQVAPVWRPARGSTEVDSRFRRSEHPVAAAGNGRNPPGWLTTDDKALWRACRYCVRG